MLFSLADVNLQSLGITVCKWQPESSKAVYLESRVGCTAVGLTQGEGQIPIRVLALEKVLHRIPYFHVLGIGFPLLEVSNVGIDVR